MTEVTITDILNLGVTYVEGSSPNKNSDRYDGADGLATIPHPLRLKIQNLAMLPSPGYVTSDKIQDCVGSICSIRDTCARPYVDIDLSRVQRGTSKPVELNLLKNSVFLARRKKCSSIVT